MYINFSKLFHESSKDLFGGGTIRISRNQKDWPEEWKTTYYKDYPLFEKIPLSDVPPKADLFETVKKRKSGRNYSDKPITKDELSVLLKYSCGETDNSFDGKNRSRAQASGGGRFPIEVYPIVFKGTEELPSGLYHYNVKEHVLDVLWKREFNKEQIGELFTYDWVQDASMAIVMTAVFWRNQNKYGERGYRYVLLEAGHIGQNIYLNSAALGFKCCALGGTWDENLEKLIDIDGVTESAVYSISLGK